MDVRESALIDLDPTTLYRILALRTDVFVVEQRCPYAELDGRDLEVSARQCWIEADGAVLATLRVLRDPSGVARIGRVATSPAARGAGLADQLMQHALASIEAHSVVLDAQSYLRSWYARFGFVDDGPEFVEDGIAHVPMRRPPRSGGEACPAGG